MKDSKRITQLEKEVKELKETIERLQRTQRVDAISKCKLPEKGSPFIPIVEA